MVSDTLFDAIKEVEEYLENETFKEVYDSTERAWILSVLQQMKTLQEFLDLPKEHKKKFWQMLNKEKAAAH